MVDLAVQLEVLRACTGLMVWGANAADRIVGALPLRMFYNGTAGYYIPSLMLLATGIRVLHDAEISESSVRDAQYVHTVDKDLYNSKQCLTLPWQRHVAMTS